MIDRVGLGALPPARRAEIIYGEAQAELSQRLWQAALGDDPSTRTPLGGARADSPGTLDTLMASLVREVQTRAATAVAGAPKPAALPDVDRAPAMSPLAPVSRTSANGPIGAVDGLGPNACHQRALIAAAERTGIPASALAAIVNAEAGKTRDGSWQIYSRNPRSSAAGLGQFLSRTWEGLAEMRGTWLHDFAGRQGWLDKDGQVRGECRAALLASRYDPAASIQGIADYARRNLDGLQRAGVSAEGDAGATARFAYLGHHLGLGDAVRFIRNRGLGADRARMLLGAQIGTAGSERRIAAAGDATSAHREWLLEYLDRQFRPDRFAALGNG